MKENPITGGKSVVHKPLQVKDLDKILGEMEEAGESRPSRAWAAFEEDALRKAYGKIPVRDLAEMFDRSISAVKSKAWLLGLAERSRPRQRVPCVFCGSGPHSIKVAVVKKDNDPETFKKLLALAGPKPPR